jgi:hypothetical protein
MKAIAILGAVLAVTAVTAANAKSLPPHEAGGPIKQGAYCWVNTDVNGNGWWDRCDNSGRPVSMRGRENDYDATGDGGGAGGNGR